MKQAIRPAMFKWRQTEPELILCAVRWYLRYSLSFRDVEELLRERGLEADHTTIWRWVQHYGPELEERLRRHLKPINRSWRVDETYVRVKGRWCYLYRALDSTGATINFVLSGLRDASTNEGLEKLRQNQYAAIISDMRRREGPREGYLLLDRLREQGDRTPLFFYTSSNAPQHKRETCDHGGQGLANNPQELFEMVTSGLLRN